MIINLVIFFLASCFCVYFFYTQLKQMWDKYMENWLSCKYEVHFNNVKLDLLKRYADDSRHDRQEIIKYVKRIYRSQSPTRPLSHSRSEQMRPAEKHGTFRRLSSTPVTQTRSIRHLSTDQNSFDDLRVSPNKSNSGSGDEYFERIGGTLCRKHSLESSVL